MLTAEVNLTGARYADRASRVQFYDEILPLSKQLPGVVQAGAVTVFPLTGNPGGGTSLHREGASKSDGFVQDVRHRVVTPEYFETIGLPLLSGHAFTADDDSASRRVVIINQALAEQKLEGLNDVQGWWLSRLEEGRLPGQRWEWNGPDNVQAPMQTLHEHYLAETGGLDRKSRRSSQVKFGRQLKKLVPKYANLQSARRENELLPADTQGRIRVLSCACLEDCRKEFERRLGVRINSDSFLD